MNFINFWFFKQFYYSIRKLFKHKILVLIIFGIIVYFLIQSKVFAVNSTTIPDFILTKANELNHNYNNFVVFRDYETHEYYIPYTVYTGNAVQTGAWTIREVNGVPSLVSPGYVAMQMVVYRDFHFVDVPISSFNSGSNRSHININYNNRLLEPVYVSPPNAIQYVNFPGHLNYDTFFSSSYRPYIVNRDTISSWSFQRLLINTDGLTLNDGDFFLDIEYLNNTYSLNINNYFFTDETTTTDYLSYFKPTYYFSIPSNNIENLITLQANTSIRFYLRNLKNGSNTSYNLSSYNLSITEQEATDINDNNNDAQSGRIDNSTQQINDSINNSDIDFSESNLPGDDTQDITQEGINGIFTSIYNAFCTGSIQNIVFPIPFTGKDISLSPLYVRQMLSSSNANWVITIIEAFWWYLISRFIISDVSKKITKIKSGNVENIENNNIKEDML